MSCPWAKITTPDPVKFEDIVSEQVANDLQAKEEKRYLNEMEKNGTKMFEAAGMSDIPQEVLEALSEDSSGSDEIIARMLQIQFDKEYDEELKREEKHYNRASKVSISFDNYRRTPLNTDFESDLEEEESVDIIERKDWDRFDTLERQIASIPQCGYKMQSDGKMLTKHDVVMSGRKNACKLLSFPPEFQTGDGEMFDLKLSNKVFNSLKMHSKHEQVRRHRIHDKKEDHATAEFGLDEFTRLLVYKMINNQLLERVNGVISIGKEAVILHAESYPTCPTAKEPLPKECVLKIFKTTLAEFKQRDKYIKDDHRFKDRIGKQTSRKTINLWAEKEMANLMRLQRANIRCPSVVALKSHVLVMSFVGEDNRPAPKLKDAHMTEADYILAYEEVIETMKKLYEDANLIHADLSEYNILWHNNQCYFIDVSQAVEPSHENAFYFLFRDCNNVINFFHKKGVPEIYTPEELFKFITGCEFNDEILLQRAVKMKPHLVDKPGIDVEDNFEMNWEKAKAGDGKIGSVEKLVQPVEIALVEPVKA